jgi:hypothetical protein
MDIIEKFFNDYQQFITNKILRHEEIKVSKITDFIFNYFNTDSLFKHDLVLEPGAKILRGRINEYYPKLFTHIDEISYTPHKKRSKIKLGRCNFPHQSIFYGTLSTDNHYLNDKSIYVMLSETDKLFLTSNNDYSNIITLGSWKLGSPLNCSIIPLPENSDVHPSFKIIADLSDKIYKSLNPKEQHFFQIITAAFRSIVDNYPNIAYFLTSWYSHNIYTDNRALIFPSSLKKGIMNIALKPSLVEDNLSITNVDLISARRLCNDFYANIMQSAGQSMLSKRKIVW